MMQRDTARDLGLSIAAHLLVIALFTVSFQFGQITDRAPPGTEQAVQAVMVNEPQVDREQQRETEAEAERQRQAEEQARREAERQRQAEEQARREAEAEAEAERLAAEREAAQAAEEARRQAEAERQRQAEAERQRQAEEQARREAEAEAERQRQAEEQARREAEAEAERQRQAEAERRRQAEEQARRVAEARGTYDGAIREKIDRTWVRPAGIPDGLSCVVAVRLGPGGTVLSAQVIRSSGNAAFDRSAETAVLRADPLPMPDDPVLAAPYRAGIELIFAPDNN